VGCSAQPTRSAATSDGRRLTGAKLRQPLGVAVVGGLLVSQLLTLYITPVVYLYLDKADQLLKRRLKPVAEEHGTHEPPAPHKGLRLLPKRDQLASR
jgi:AcrB/AcrD/AcrF family